MKMIVCMQGCQNKPATEHFTVYSENVPAFLNVCSSIFSMEACQCTT